MSGPTKAVLVEELTRARTSAARARELLAEALRDHRRHPCESKVGELLREAREVLS